MMDTKEEFVVCAFIGNAVESTSVDLVLRDYCEFAIETNGGSDDDDDSEVEAHLTGYYVPEYDEDEDAAAIDVRGLVREAPGAGADDRLEDHGRSQGLPGLLAAHGVAELPELGGDEIGAREADRLAGGELDVDSCDAIVGVARDDLAYGALGHGSVVHRAVDAGGDLGAVGERDPRGVDVVESHGRGAQPLVSFSSEA